MKRMGRGVSAVRGNSILASSSVRRRSFGVMAAALGTASLMGCGPEVDGGLSGESTALVVPRYEVITQESAVDSGSFQQLQVACPAGTKALGAGWGVLDETGAILDGVATYSAPSWDGSGWMVNASNKSTYAQRWKLSVRLLCAPFKDSAGYEVVPFETAVDSNGWKQLQVRCPEGKKALGAGWGALDDTSGILEGQALHFGPSWDGSGWLVNAHNNSSFAPDWKLSVRLVCASATSLPTHEVVTQETPVESTTWKQLQVECPAGRRALGAGWSVLDDTSGILDGEALYFQSGFDGSHWLVNAMNLSTGFSPEGKLRVRLLCM